MLSVLLIVVLSRSFLLVEAGDKVVIDDNSSYPVVKTNLGIIRGRKSEDGTYSMFMGIPYAQVNESNIFGPAIPSPKFDDIFDALDDSAMCPQRDELTHTTGGSLDCLHVNVYVPNKAGTKNRLPVLVWIFGGALQIGHAGTFLYGPSFIVRHDVILVTLNYRLGPYGFFCLDIPEVAGNQGLKDQVLALRWVKNNINAFGGDDNRITLGGHSIGATCVHLHLYYLKEKLFHRIISQSATPSVDGLFVESDLNHPIRIARKLKYLTNDTKDALEFLSKIDVKTVVTAVLQLGLMFSPCIEKEFVNADNYITEHPVDIELPNLKEIDILIGITNEEIFKGLVKLSFLSPKLLNKTRPITIAFQKYFDFSKNKQVLAEMEEEVKQFYIGGEDISIDNYNNVSDIICDFFINYQTIKSVRMYLEKGATNMYFYIFSYTGGRNFMRNMRKINSGGALHADELGYLFDISYMKKSLDSADELIVDRMTELWTNFIKYGNPTPAPTELVPLVWPRVTLKKKYFLQLDTELRVIANPLHSRMAFLDLFYKKNEQYLKYQKLRKNKTASSGSSMFHLDLWLLCLLSILFSFAQLCYKGN